MKSVRQAGRLLPHSSPYNTPCLLTRSYKVDHINDLRAVSYTITKVIARTRFRYKAGLDNEAHGRLSSKSRRPRIRLMRDLTHTGTVAESR